MNIELNYMDATIEGIDFDSDSDRMRAEKYTELNNQAIIKCENGDFESAILDFTEAIDMYPSLRHAYHNRAIAKYQSSVIDFASSFGFKIDLASFSADLDILRSFCHLFNKVF